MEIKVLGWNIGGGLSLDRDKHPAAIKSYNTDALTEISEFIQRQSPDIISLQEVHRNRMNGESQAKHIAEKLGYTYYVDNFVSLSHKDPLQDIGNSIISRYPILYSISDTFTNPQLEAEWEDGSKAISLDKGFITVSIDLGSTGVVAITNLHLVPFRRFNVSNESRIIAQSINEVFATIDKSYSRWIIQGDFNIHSHNLAKQFSEITSRDITETTSHLYTTPTGYIYDHVLYRGVTLNSNEVLRPIHTDHFPVISSFTL